MGVKMPKGQLAMLEECERRGFTVLDARNYFEDLNSQKPRLCQVIRTPYLYDSNPVIALTSTSRKNANRDRNGYLTTGMVDLFVASNRAGTAVNIDNFEDAVKTGQLSSLSDIDPGGTSALLDPVNRRITQRDAYGEVQRFASACAEFGHMKICDEYIEDMMVLADMMDMEKPTEAQYWNDYVPTVIQDLEDGENGRISPMTEKPYRMMGRVKTSKEARAWARTHGEMTGG